MGIRYGELEKDDAEGLIQLRLSVMKTDPYSFSVSEKEERKSNIENIEKAIESYSISKEKQMLGAWDVELVGVVGIERYRKEHEKHKVRLWGPYINKSNRRNGIANNLIKKVLSFAFTIDGVEIVTLETTAESTSSFCLFKKHGFEKTGSQYNALCFEGKYVDLLYMQRDKST